ncbi:MAG: DNA-binding LacI/PurR family transcriptional regulator [Rhodothermales bacterium]|jgi:DNA-binding LacI/PurR family transcriptional regulator
MKATLADVSKKAGVSTATVSRVINGSDLVGKSTRQLVEAVIQELDYVPSHAARSLAGKRSDTLAVVFPRVESGFYSEMLTGLYEEAAHSGFNLMTVFANREDPMLIRGLRDGRCDALVVLNLDLPSSVTGQLAYGDLPVVVINRRIAGDGISVVELDNAAGVAAMMDHLVSERGFRHIAILEGPRQNIDTQLRVKAVRAKAQDMGISLREPFWQGHFTEAGGYTAMATYLDSDQPLPEVLFALNDTMAFGALLCMRDRRLSVPEDMALVGFDNLPASRMAGLTTIDGAAREQGREACRIAIGMVRNSDQRTRRLLAPKLVVRDSCRRQA